MTLIERLDEYEKLMRLDKPIGILLLAWPTLWALWLASSGGPHWVLLVVFTVGTVLMRSAGCVVNDFADRDFDPHVERTKHRPLAARRVTEKEALILAGVLALLAFLLILPQAYLGIAFGFCIPMAYAAVLGHIPNIAWLLLAANIVWAIAYDTEYAMVDRADDVKIGIRTSAITFGRFDVAAVMLCYLGTLVLLASVGWWQHLRWPFYLGLAAAAGIAGYHYTLIRGREPARCFTAFLHNNWFGAAVFAGIAASFVL